MPLAVALVEEITSGTIRPTSVLGGRRRSSMNCNNLYNIAPQMFADSLPFVALNNCTPYTVGEMQAALCFAVISRVLAARILVI